MTRSVALYVPALPCAASPGQPADARYPALETLLARARRRALPAAGIAGLVQWLTASRWRLDDGWSVAAVCRLGEGSGAAPDERWLRADPVHLLAAADRLHLVPPAELTIDAEIARTLVRVFNDHFVAEDYRLEAPDPRRWYLRAPRPLRIDAHPPAEVAGRDVLELMPGGPDATAVKRLMTEAQMLFHARLERSGEMSGTPVNGIWIWGGGRLPRAEPAALPPLWSDEPCARGIWRVTGNSVRSLPATARDWLAGADAAGVIVLDEPPRAGSREGLERLERDWCAPLLAALARGELSVLDVVAAGTARYELSRAGLHRFWRRRHPLSGEPAHAD